MLERFAFRTEYEKTDDYKMAVVLSISTSIALIALSIFLSGIYSLSYTLGLGAMVYQIYALFVLYIMAEKRIGVGRHFVTFALFLLMLTMVMMVYNFDRTRIRENPIGVALGFIVTMAPMFFWEEFMGWSREHIKKIMVLGILAPLFMLSLPTAYAQNETSQPGTLEKISGILNIAHNAVEYISNIFGFFGGIQNAIQEMLGISPAQAQVVNIGLMLVVAYFFMRAMKWLVKWVILILFTWIALQIVGVI